MGVIYLRTNTVNGMQYVGQTKDFRKRQRHWYCLKHKYSNNILTDDRVKYGLDNFTYEILKECDNSELDNWEKYYIREYNTVFPNGYNANDGGTINFHHSDETKKKIAETKIGEKNGMYGAIPWNKGKKGCFSEETIQKMSKSAMGNHSALGHIVSEESKKKWSKERKGISNKKLAKLVIQVKPNGDVVEWESVRQCKDNGFKGVDRVCRGERPIAYGCKWYYKDAYEKMLAELPC